MWIKVFDGFACIKAVEQLTHEEKSYKKIGYSEAFYFENQNHSLHSKIPHRKN